MVLAAVNPIVSEAFSKGYGAAFWWDPESGLHWGDTHYMIFHNLFNGDMEPGMNQEQGLFGWVFEDDNGWEDYNPAKPSYAIDFGTDFGYGANKTNMKSLMDTATQAVEKDMGYPPVQVTTGYSEFTEHEAGHAYESEDELNEQADSINMSGAPYCQNCGSDISGEICGDCGAANLGWWTPLNTFKGKVSWIEDKSFEYLILLDKRWNEGYNTKTSSWDEEFDEPVDEDLGDFKQEVIGLTDSERQQYGIEGPFEINGWTAYTRDCDDVYPTHDAIWIDRKNKIILIGYQGHHHDLFKAPFFTGIAQKAPYDNQTAGHFRTAPSSTEPFPAGWGWHGSPGTKDEKDVLKEVLKQHYKVDKLKDLYTPNENADENYFEDEA